jgi:hypothetical protein
MNTPIEIDTQDADRIVYVRPVNIDELPAEVRDDARGHDQLYAVHSPDGERLAIVQNRELAFVLARQNDYAPVPVH